MDVEKGEAENQPVADSAGLGVCLTRVFHWSSGL